ncbi:hypothetical protein D3OALGA1CA_5507 [Olavius algarvensis associated proteobacterium Delta 3]|nr:hypothetical protein D3OALGB2SA_1351 [Olavius algarvensis associated proteobacterium Delta 3]CAB5167753.1 hypothetical protein D3OALGA1CA_5507 [Olavius algarvensis associated proteobacterium Delta 3]
MDLDSILPIMLSGTREGEASQVTAFISECGLHTEDITPAKLRHFIIARKGSRIVGTVGIEAAGSYALLRSLAVAEPFRRKRLGTRLAESMEKYARDHEVKHLYLLTRTAEAFFSSVGFNTSERAAAPASIQDTEEFRTLCPDTAVCMYKKL